MNGRDPLLTVNGFEMSRDLRRETLLSGRWSGTGCGTGRIFDEAAVVASDI